MKVKRLTGAELAALAAPAEPSPARRQDRHGDLVQVNFRCTDGMARLLGRMAEGCGSIRVAIARLLRDEYQRGHLTSDVPAADLVAPSSRRRL